MQDTLTFRDRDLRRNGRTSEPVYRPSETKEEEQCEAEEPPPYRFLLHRMKPETLFRTRQADPLHQASSPGQASKNTSQRHGRGVERLEVAASQPHHRRRVALGHSPPVGGRASRPQRAQRGNAAVHHPLLRESARTRQPGAAPSKVGGSGHGRALQVPRRVRRPAGRGIGQPRARPRAPLPGPGALSGDRFLLHLLPLLHALAHGRPLRRRIVHQEAVGEGPGLY